ncbi:putative protein kinase RLK-Pelle-L-LEC family [Helianthus annuus]|uniref:non-specific serine/threonine protein kinase n=2 Tax=Helianthus annuus TaxID=4232 RepID=A0A251V4T5_HELAN|nr:putative protein kinase RLK-Pelle-L-LEC family [Helianthus annuus]KAJ0773350.1 putative protein kinase RLK-Pelle-L-LEC family [Helianthus annuus]KAJ0934961.1 putative protein kinase RLK-Pelle-L-LEC family [Helianthus annuus]
MSWPTILVIYSCYLSSPTISQETRNSLASFQIMSMLSCFFLALIPYATSVTFNFANITSLNTQDIVFSGDAAYASDDGIQVTHERNSDRNSSWLAGRATYNKLLRLWDKDSTALASFSTSFTFVIDSYKSGDYADGLTFFLAQNNSVMISGGSLGLPFDTHNNTSIHPFVAVEFDSFFNEEYDPSIGHHVGININSMTSVMYRKWLTNIEHGHECKAMISYSSDSKNLSVSFTNFKDNLLVWETPLNYTIDLRDVLPESVIFGFSASTGVFFEKNSVRSWMFNSSESKVYQSSNPSTTKSPNAMNGVTIGLIAGTPVLVIVSAILAYLLWKKKSIGDRVEDLESALEMNNELEMGAIIPRRFSYLELARSTADFAETEKLGEGGFGGVYKGFLKDLSMYVAVKRVSKTSKQGMKEYASEVRIISRLRHRNLVQLTGWCHDKGELLLAYEYMENGSLDLHLFKGKSLLTWNTRYKIAHGLASALLYLHEEWEQCVLHRDIKSSNVMLDSNFNVKLGDFGLAKLVDHENGSETTIVAGTIGYMAPEYATTGKPSKESDVYSFGVVALEIACGRKPIDPHAEERKIKLVEWVWDLYGSGTLLEAADRSLGSNFVEEEMTCLMIIGLWCAHPDSKLRPSIKQAIQVLNSEASLPILPSNMPYVTYSALPHFSLYGATLSSSSNKRSSRLSASSTANS